MGKLISIGTVTKLDLDPDRILEMAKGKLEGVVIIGFQKEDGKVFAGSSYADGGDVMWLLKACESKMMRAVEDHLDEE